MPPAPPMSMRCGCFDLKTDGPSEADDGDTSRFHQVNFDRPFRKGAKVVVLAQVQTFNGVNTPGIRIAEVNEFGFKIRLNELVGHPDGKLKRYSDGHHKEETIGYVAYECRPRKEPPPKNGNDVD